MKNIKFGLLMILAVSAMASCGQSASGEFEIIRINPNQETAKEIASAYNLSIKRYTEYGVTTYVTKSEDQYNTLLNMDYGFAKNGTYETAVSNDTYSWDQYGLKMIRADEAWAITEGTPEVVVAVIDTGVDHNHPELSSSLSPLSYNARTGEVGPAAASGSHPHGTNVAGVIAAQKDNDAGIAGVSPRVTIMAIKASYDYTNSSGQLVTTSSFLDADLINSVYYAVDNGADIVNMSIAGSSYNSLMKRAVDYAESMGVVVIAAAGNSRTSSARYPSSYESVVSVSALNKDGSFASSYSNFGAMIDISAPGSEVLTTSRNNSYTVTSGTSFAAPHVAGTAALIKSVYPELTAAELKQKMYDSAVDAGTTGRDDYYGHGIVDAFSAISSSMRTVYFNTMGGTTVPSLMVVPGSTITLPADPLKEHHVFSGWYSDNTYTQAFDSEQTVNSSMTLYAKWTPNVYTVTFNSDGGTAVQSLSSSYGEVTAGPSDPTKEGHAFSGWYTSEGTRFTFPANLAKDIVLKAQWDIASYTVSFDSNGGSPVQSESVTYGETVSEPSSPTKEGHTFAGWETSDGSAFDFSSAISSDTQLTARWTKNSYDIIYLSHDGTEHARFSYEYGFDLSGHVQPAGPAKEANIFAGWVGTLPSTMPSSDIVLAPSYDKVVSSVMVTITVTITYEDGTTETLTFTADAAVIEFILNYYGIAVTD
jgi:uncharacterized repeat protein (TIGR02543 family)